PTSAACHTRKPVSLGRASTTSGTSQTTYCGDQTLLVTKNAAVSRKISCSNRGRLGAATASAMTPTQAIRNRAADRKLIVGNDRPPTTGQCSVWKKYQIEPQSAPRFALKI